MGKERKWGWQPLRWNPSFTVGKSITAVWFLLNFKKKTTKKQKKKKSIRLQARAKRNYEWHFASLLASQSPTDPRETWCVPSSHNNMWCDGSSANHRYSRKNVQSIGRQKLTSQRVCTRGWRGCVLHVIVAIDCSWSALRRTNRNKPTSDEWQARGYCI